MNDRERLEELDERLAMLEGAREFDNEYAGPAELLRSAWVIGACLAAAISWTAHHAIGWATLHALLSWAYVVYFAITR